MSRRACTPSAGAAGDRSPPLEARHARPCSAKEPPSYSDSAPRGTALRMAVDSTTGMVATGVRRHPVNDKGSQWQPSSRSVVCSLHFKEEDYKKFVGSSTGETGVTSLIKERLQVERKGLRSEKEPYCSLIIDEMLIQQKVIYDRQVDRIFGLVDIRCEARSKATEVANRLLCFVLRVLSTAYVIPAGYFFTRNLKHDQLRIFTLSVVKAVEEAGFRKVRIVTDNHQTNTAMFRQMSDDNTLQHVVPHPVREGEPLFLSFDPNHLIKNLRTNLLEREMFDGAQMIKGGFF
ncbi:hypothetical protein HPB47_022935 [Ixodes persulcatus]|uniref:Uncharacterized protein n=1 Tax=Ixodes persulcatus TaxID=34615 RepID=A0AC60Q8D6_IXOPE|nr:hypothetical protein HPB47_022935 [Ixodes persulcatus]